MQEKKTVSWKTEKGLEGGWFVKGEGRPVSDEETTRYILILASWCGRVRIVITHLSGEGTAKRRVIMMLFRRAGMDGQNEMDTYDMKD